MKNKSYNFQLKLPDFSFLTLNLLQLVIKLIFYQIKQIIPLFYLPRNKENNYSLIYSIYYATSLFYSDKLKFQCNFVLVFRPKKLVHDFLRSRKLLCVFLQKFFLGLFCSKFPSENNGISLTLALAISFEIWPIYWWYLKYCCKQKDMSIIDLMHYCI